MARKSSAARAAAEDNELDVDYSERNGFLTGKAAAMADWFHRKDEKAFGKLVNVIRVGNWQRANPERTRAIKLAYYRRNRDELVAEVRLRERNERAKSWKPDTTVYVCKGCGTQWCRVLPKPAGKDLTKRGHGPGPAPDFCTAECWRRSRYQQQRNDPAWVEENRRRSREYSRRKRDERRPTHATDKKGT